jgi:hypothetical protein
MLHLPEAAQDHDARRPGQSLQGFRNTDSVEPGHYQIHQRHVRCPASGDEIRDSGNRLRSVGSLAHNIDADRDAQVRRQSIPDDRMIIYDEHPDDVDTRRDRSHTHAIPPHQSVNSWLMIRVSPAESQSSRPPNRQVRALRAGGANRLDQDRGPGPSRTPVVPVQRLAGGVGFLQRLVQKPIRRVGIPGGVAVWNLSALAGLSMYRKAPKYIQ